MFFSAITTGTPVRARYSRDQSFGVIRANIRFVVAMSAGSIVGTVLGGVMNIGIYRNLADAPHHLSSHARQHRNNWGSSRTQPGASLPRVARSMTSGPARPTSPDHSKPLEKRHQRRYDLSTSALDRSTELAAPWGQY